MLWCIDELVDVISTSMTSNSELLSDSKCINTSVQTVDLEQDRKQQQHRKQYTKPANRHIKASTYNAKIEKFPVAKRGFLKTAINLTKRLLYIVRFYDKGWFYSRAENLFGHLQTASHSAKGMVCSKTLRWVCWTGNTIMYRKTTEVRYCNWYIF